MTQLNGAAMERTGAILQLLKDTGGLMPVSAIHDRLPNHLRGSAQLTFQECNRLAKEGYAGMEQIAGGRAAFKFIKDLEGGVGAPPLAPPAVAAAEATKPSQASPTLQADEPSGRRAKTAALRNRILGLLKTSSWRSDELAKALNLPESTLGYHLTCMRKAQLAHPQGGGNATTWHAGPEDKTGAIAAVEQARSAVVRKLNPLTVTKALERLSLGSSAARPPIQRLELKLKVLDRLAELVEPTIAAVLQEIRADISPG